jgi:lipopolysaccharide/colanic/teichoic acid biosynthesis glycosyltransferase
MCQNYIKRGIDIILSIAAFMILSWLMILIVIGYVLLWQFPILFSQVRIGKNNIPFTMYKFRTLNTSEDLSNEQRRFWLGDVLRFLSLDEIPQLWNVLRGDMSFVGPRPLPMEYMPLYSVDQIRRHEVKPGITGWAQVNGRNSISWKEKFELDLYYVNHVSMKLDLLIFLKTILIWFSFHKDVSLREEKFQGNNPEQLR